MPWQEVERCYAESFADTGMGAPAKSGRIAYGALGVKEPLGKLRIGFSCCLWRFPQFLFYPVLL